MKLSPGKTIWKDNLVNSLPRPAGKPAAVRIRPSAERAVRSGHPWVFNDSILEISREGAPGDLAVIFDRKNRFLAVGLLDPASSIAVRILQANHPVQINRDFYRRTLDRALGIRKPLLAASRAGRTTGFRIVSGENDGFPGLVLDRYGKTLVMKIYTPAWLPHLADVLGALEETLAFKHLVLRTDHFTRHAAHEAGLDDGCVLTAARPDSPVLFNENGLVFEADPIHGQKTGFFLDQRENRARVETFSKNASVLNLFSYTGGFSVYAARGGANSITDVDSCSEAAEASLRNMRRNRDAVGGDIQYQVLQKDVNSALADLFEQGRLFDIVIADPPAFARSQGQVRHALEMYARITRRSLRVLRRGGLLVQASCSSPVPADEFYDTISSAAASAKRPLHDIEYTGHPLDHPAEFQQGHYLKCLFARAG